ncbi:MAG: calycin-like domain-containing protein [Bacteroidales bacterium]|nr:calycin-like domain-containing protein [Bacteroidales bacterium]MDY5280449.1 calycin-like domain-containing protein [Sodaliphilus sp.]
MRKLSTLFCAVLMTLSAMATDYKGNLTVSINGEGSTQPATISIVENAGKYNLSILNFMLGEGESVLPVGNIVIENVTGAVAGNLTTLYVNKNITIQKGNVAGIADDAWLGPMLGEVPVKMSSSFNTNGFLGVNIDIDMVSTLGQVIKVTFENVGNHFQMPNSDFETWSTATDNNAPKHWHGFESVKGKLSGTAKSKTKLVSSKNVRPGSKGLTSAVVTSTKVFTVIANGTMTNGVLNAGSMYAADASNHSETDLSSTSKDANGDPFATPMYAKPDSVKFWMRFTQAKAQASYPNAAFNAVITDGTYYQDPENKTYTNKVAVAAPNKADMTVGDWRLVSCPFDYASYAANGAEAKAILLTVSTNATPGKGSYSNGVADSVYVDDLELVYAAGIKSISFKGQALDLATIQTTGIELAADEAVSAADFEVVKEGEDAKVTKLVEATADGYVAVITAVSADLKTQVAYEINIKKPAAPVLKGDINGDGVLDVADASALIDMVLNSGTCTEVADVNGDGALDVADVTELITLILG